MKRYCDMKRMTRGNNFMTLDTIKTPYDQDFMLWLTETVQHLKSGNFDQIDLENLIEEVEALSRQEKRELKNRLTTLFEHILKLQYVSLPECYRGWEITIARTQNDLKDILEDSPSLKNYLEEICEQCYQRALKNVVLEYPSNFPHDFPFSTNPDVLLTHQFWQK